MPCCHCEAAEKEFASATARADLKRYRRKGPRGTTRALLGELRQARAAPASLLDIGGGVGAMVHELLGSGVGHAVLVEASSAYIAEAKAEAARRGTSERLSCWHGDFVELADNVEPADLVTLDRVVCCYPDVEALVRTSAGKSRRWYGLSLPRDRWYVRAVMGIQNSVRKLRGNSFRTYVHAESEIAELLERAGFVLRFSDRGLVWKSELYQRSEAR